ncbi:hypothetical protein F4861DRAFT_16436 [Xylaria intraflava]|nr:hypothetical protein F4861DRAFT_16436 [Xylaria intraflava]
MLPQPSSRLRGWLLVAPVVVVGVSVLITFWNIWPSIHVNSFFVATKQVGADNMSDSVLSALKVSVRQASTSPPQLTIGVTNTYSSPITVLAWESPLDPLALQLGLLSFIPKGEDAPIKIPRIMVRRRMPPDDDAYVTISPGQTEERDVPLNKPLIPLEKFQGKIEVVCKGDWKGAWTSKKEDMPAEALKQAGADAAALKGKFESEPVEIEF